jgi:tetratricopeptide (TPR) repeat protein
MDAIDLALQKAGALQAQGDLIAAKQIAEDLFKQNPQQYSVLLFLGNLHALQNETSEAIRYLTAAASIHPEKIKAWCDLGVLLTQMNQLKIAVDCYLKVLAIDPQHLSTLQNIALLYLQLEQPKTAIEYYQQALVMNPYQFETQCNLGSAYLKLKEFDAAWEYTQRALNINPQSVVVYHNLGSICLYRNEPQQAIDYYLQTLRINPHYFMGYSSLALAYLRFGQPEKALEYCEKAHAIIDQEPENLFNEAWALLLLGNYQLGWQKYQTRWQRATLQKDIRPFTQARLTDLQQVSARKILLHSEQGFGDTIQFVRYASLLATMGATVYLEVQPQLKTLVSAVAGVTASFGRGDPLPEFDYYCPLMDLPSIFKTEIHTIPQTPSYLSVPIARKQYWSAQMLAHKKKLKVGVLWSGNPNFVYDASRSLSFELIKPFLATAGCQFFSLQKEVKPIEENAVITYEGLIDCRPMMTDFVETAAIIEQMDLIITSCTALAHLAGALGKPTWIMLAYAADWRWLLTRDDSPWYPSARLFRQPQLNDWQSVVAVVLENLQLLVTKNSYLDK